MSDAMRKNQAAVVQATGDAALTGRLQSCRIGVWSDPTAARASGSLLAEALGDVLGRLWYNLDVSGPLAATCASAAQVAAASGRQPITVQERWAPPYDYVISIGGDAPPGSGPAQRIGASGWTVMAGAAAVVADDPNPVGPAAAAALAALETFKILFADGLRTRVRPLPATFIWSAWDYGANDPTPTVVPIRLDDMHVFGVGAVTHGLLWVLNRWPTTVSGSLHLIDADMYDVSNGQRYIGMRPENIGLSKPVQAAERLMARHASLEVYPHPKDMNRYFDEDRPDCRVNLAIAGLDSPEGRRQLALKLPRRVVNMWTDHDHLGAARFGVADGWPCLFCAYGEDPTAPRDEAGQIYEQTGIQPARARELLNSAAPLDAMDVALLAQRYGQDKAQAYLGQPLRSVLGALCATGQIVVPGTQTVVDVPFGFSSFLSGIGGFVELAREVWGVSSPPGHWQLPVFAAPVSGNWSPRGPKQNCYLCADPLLIDILQKKYGVIMT